MNQKISYGLLVLVLSTFACRPVLAISWNEFLLIGGLILVLLGPSLYRGLRRLEDFFRHREKNN